MRNFDGRLDQKSSLTILASGSGTTAEVLIRATLTRVLDASVDLVISNNENAGVFDRVEQLNSQYGLQIKTEWVGKQNFPNGATDIPFEQTDAESEEIYELAQNVAYGKIMVVMMAGYLRKVRGALLEECGAQSPSEPYMRSNLFNTHPGILPVTRGYHGRGVHKRVVNLGLRHSAQVLHGVTHGYDEGPKYKTNHFPVPVASADTIDEEREKLVDRVEEIAQSTEKAHLPVDLNNLLSARREYLKSQF
jgi:folate-dependent phosphoribosylglycinamide formyltransferase PurN